MFIRSHPVRNREGFADWMIPLRLHGDGTPVTGLGKQWGKLVDVYSVASLLVTAPVKLKTPALRSKYTFNGKSLGSLKYSFGSC
jgi:hypothetical protein